MDSHNNIDQSVSELLLDPASVQQLYNSQLRGPEFDQQRQIRNQVLPFNKMTDTIDNDNIPLSVTMTSYINSSVFHLNNNMKIILIMYTKQAMIWQHWHHH